jgi:hypothetical protein
MIEGEGGVAVLLLHVIYCNLYYYEIKLCITVLASIGTA